MFDERLNEANAFDKFGRKNSKIDFFHAHARGKKKITSCIVSYLGESKTRENMPRQCHVNQAAEQTFVKQANKC